MAKGKATFRARASLIDRLVDINPQFQREARPLRTLTRDEIKASLLRDLTWLFNSRTSHPHHFFDERDLTVIDFGIPDFGDYSPQNPEDRVLLAQRLKRAISAFEPRLKKVTVTVAPDPVNEKTLQVHLDGVITWESVREPVSFTTVFNGGAGLAEIHENK